MISFDLLEDESSIHIESYFGPQSDCGELSRPDELLTSQESFTLHITYPFKNPPAPLSVHAPGGLTRAQFVSLVCSTYAKVFEQNETSDQYGNWGHGLGDLFLESADIEPDGAIKLHIGS